jgi:hypothetical protein
MTDQPSWLDLGKELAEIRHVPLRAEWYAYEGSEDYGIWLLRPAGPQTDGVCADFSLFAARAIEKLGIPPIPVPQSCQHFPDWNRFCDILGLSDAVPFGLGVVDRDAVDPCTRAWLEWLRRQSAEFRSVESPESMRGRTYNSLSGTIQDLCSASVVSCTRLARNEIGARLVRGRRHSAHPLEADAVDLPAPAPAKRTAARVKRKVQAGRAVQEAKDRAARRQRVVSPILEQKRWKRGRLVTDSGVGKATVYGYLNGTRASISKDNRKAIADSLELKLEQLPS